MDNHRDDSIANFLGGWIQSARNEPDHLKTETRVPDFDRDHRCVLATREGNLGLVTDRPGFSWHVWTATP
jgi:hypothetical protein